MVVMHTKKCNYSSFMFVLRGHTFLMQLSICDMIWYYMIQYDMMWYNTWDGKKYIGEIAKNIHFRCLRWFRWLRIHGQWYNWEYIVDNM